MPFYTGKTKDGSDMIEHEGMYVNPNNHNEWSSKPYPAQKRTQRLYDTVTEYMDGKYTLNDVYKQIQAKTCKLSHKVREYVLSYYDDNGDFINTKNN